MVRMCLFFLIICVSGLKLFATPINIGSRRQLFVDKSLIEKMDNIELRMHHPHPEEKSFSFDKPWEGPFSGCYATVIKDGQNYRMYYRAAQNTKQASQVTCLAESKDGIDWQKPNVNLYEYNGCKNNNIVFSHDSSATHNFSPFIDNNPACPPTQRYKAIGGLQTECIMGFVSPDGINWTMIEKQPLIENPAYLAFDSQNVVFWSETEEKYICYCRIWPGVDLENIDITNAVRRVGRSTSKDFINWSPIRQMKIMHNGQLVPDFQLYTNQTLPYFRSPNFYIAMAVRFIPGKRVISQNQAEQIHVNSKYFNDCSDIVLLSTKPDSTIYNQTFLSSFLRPGYGPENWVSRTNYPVLGLAETGPSEMSMYVCKNYAQPTSHIQRYSLRIDGFASIHADYEKGTLLTSPLLFEGNRLEINFWTSAAGSVKIEIQDEYGNPFNDFTFLDCQEIIGNSISHVVKWENSSDLSSLAGKKVRLLFELKDADLYSFVFVKGEGK